MKIGKKNNIFTNKKGLDYRFQFAEYGGGPPQDFYGIERIEYFSTLIEGKNF